MVKLLKVNEVSEILGLKVSTIYKYTMSRKLPFIKLGGSLRFDIEKIEEFIQENSKEPIQNQKAAI